MFKTKDFTDICITKNLKNIYEKFITGMMKKWILIVVEY